MTPLLVAAILSGALVTAAGQRTTRTNERGEFRFEDLPAGTYRLAIETPGFFRERPPEVTLAATDDARLPTVTLHAGLPLPPGCDYSLQPAAIKRTPAARASFRGWTSTRGETVTLGDRAVQARRDGFFEFPCLESGNYKCVLTREAVELDGWITPDSSTRVLRQPKRRQPAICL